MNDNILIQKIITLLQNGLSAIGQGSILILQDYQPTQEGTPSAPTIFLHKVMDERMGAVYRQNAWNQTLSASFTGAISANILSVSAISSGSLGIGQTIQDGEVNIPQNVYINTLGSGSGGTGTYNLNASIAAPVPPESMTAIPGMVYTETQQYITTFQFNALATQDPSNTANLTASDILNYAAYVMQSLTTITALEAIGVGVLKIGQIRNPYFVDDRDRFEANPSFDVSFTTKQTIITVQPVVTEEVFQILTV